MSMIHHFSGSLEDGDYSWEGIKPTVINRDEVQNVLKHVLIGPDDGSNHFIVRYFQVPVEGKTFFHKHEHEHGMLILHGQARIQIEEDFFEAKPLDALFIAGSDLHQVANTGDTPLGFLCIIPEWAKEK